MQIHDLIQGTDEWCQFRLEHHGASEAAAMLNISKKTTRNELLRMKSTGIGKEFTDWVQENILDYGHEVEALARPITEKILECDLYPVTCSDGRLSASCDGLTLFGSQGWEHKQWNETLAACVVAGELPDEFMVQPQQCLMVTGANVWTFTVSDGTEENRVSMDIYPDQAWFDRIRAGWEQFNIDLANYVYVEPATPVVAKVTLDLPSVSIQVNGEIALISNLNLFDTALKNFISDIPTNPSNDQEFADCKSAIGKLKQAEEALDAAEANALGQIASFDEMRRMKEQLFNLSRETRLAVEKLVTKREAAIKVEITGGAKALFDEHVAQLNKRLGKDYMPKITADFVTAIKNKRTIASLQNAVDSLLAEKKMEANAIADKLQINLNSLRELAKDHAFLFADTQQIIFKENEDLILLINSRINEHNTAEQKRIEALAAAEVERIRAADQEAKRVAEQAAANAELKAHQDKLNAEQAAQPAAKEPIKAATVSKLIMPTREQMINVIAAHYQVDANTAAKWLANEFSTKQAA